ncbi:hypothetical protein CPB83DRAFT_898004 [Crepidotus variabilis]|uniref:DUF6534 domain-containing protein n=1 Tax=Crepidotus variabilis TaxID=179855 RepID=A0A9P6E859_9AGAR|nr:hypothetical protein CPB83DRAFT_898004 [Crepidotus variabilis]
MKGPAEIAHGPMLIGFTINVLLYGVMTTQVYLYYTAYKNDKIWMKLFVFFLLLADTANTIFDFVYLFRSLIIHFGDANYLSKADWLFATDPAITGITASVVQLFFSWRVRVLTHNRFFSILVMLGALAGGAGAIATSFEVGRTPEFVRFRQFKGVVITWLAAAAFTDVLITMILVWYLVRRFGFRKSDLMVDRIIRLTVQTGLITCLVASLDLIFFLTDPTGIHLIFNFPLCKLYTNSLMSSLNSRRGWKLGNTGVDYSVQSGDLGVISAPTFPNSSLSQPGSGNLFSLKPLRSTTSDSESATSSPLDVNGTELTKPASTACHPARQGHPEVFVHVESHQSSDTLYVPQRPRALTTGSGEVTHNSDNNRTLSRGVPLSLDTNMTLSNHNGKKLDSDGGIPPFLLPNSKTARMGFIDLSNLGPAEVAHGWIFIGLVINILLLGIMITQVYLYYVTYKHDKLWIKLFVAGLFLADVLNTAFDTAYMYRTLIIQFGNLEALTKADWLFGCDPGMTAMIAMAVQLFFAWRVYVLTKTPIWAVIIVFVALTGGVAGLITAVDVVRIPKFVEFQKFKPVVIIWLASEAIGDIIITSILVLYLVSTEYPTSFD